MSKVYLHSNDRKSSPRLYTFRIFGARVNINGSCDGGTAYIYFNNLFIYYIHSYSGYYKVYSQIFFQFLSIFAPTLTEMKKG